jgi:hypothetical protein
MAKNTLAKHLRRNPKARRHANVIKETLKALEALKDAGMASPGYGLQSPYGGSKAPDASSSARKGLSRLKVNVPA